MKCSVCFSIFQAPEESYFSVHIRSAGDWTGMKFVLFTVIQLFCLKLQTKLLLLLFNVLSAALHKEFGVNDSGMKDIGDCPR